MPGIDPIQNLEPAASVRAKLNAAITEANKVAEKADLAPDDGNYRIKGGNELQLRETSPAPGWRTVWLVNGQLNFGELDVS